MRITTLACIAVVCLMLFGCIPQEIMFESDRDGDSEIYSMTVAGGGLLQLTHNAAGDSAPAWSRDGLKVAFDSDRDGNWDIFVMNPDGTGQTNITKSDDNEWSPSFNADASKIVYWTDRHKTPANPGDHEIYVMAADGTGATRLTNHLADDREAVFSPVDDLIAFTSSRSGNYDVYTMKSDGTDVTQLTVDAGADQTPSFSPDGSTIVWATTRDGNSEIYAMRIDGSGKTRLTKTPDRHEGRPGYSPDGKLITYMCVGEDLRVDVWLMNANGTGQVNLTNNPAWDDFPVFRGSH